MPEPDVTSGSAQKQREEEEDNEVEVEVAGGGDDDPPDEPGEGVDQTHPSDDDDTGSLLGGTILTNRKVVVAVVVVSLVVLYLAYRGGAGNANRGRGENPAPREDVDGIEDINRAVQDGPPPAERQFNVPQDKQDPLRADEYILKSTDIFPSLSDAGGSTGPEHGVNEGAT